MECHGAAPQGCGVGAISSAFTDARPISLRSVMAMESIRGGWVPLLDKLPALKRKQAGNQPACRVLVGGAGFEPATLAV